MAASTVQTQDNGDDDANDCALTTKVCVIGAGVNGLCVTKHLLDNGIRNITVFECSSRIGGLWNYEPDPNYPNALYKNLTTNIHRGSMHFPDLEFETKCEEMYPHHSVILQYIHYYAKHFDLLKYIRFNHKILKVTPPSMTDDAHSAKHSSCKLPAWNIEYQQQSAMNDTTESKTQQPAAEQELFEVVIVCNGHFVLPYIPSIEGLDSTKIPWFHSRNYREPKSDLFDGKLIVLIGAGYSGRDIGKEIFSKCSEVTIYQVVHSKYAYGSKQGYYYKCFLKRVNVDSVEFDDGTIVYPDLMIVCTGYLHHLPFLDHAGFKEHPLVKVKDGFECNGQSVNGLFQHVIYPHLPTIFFAGINHGVYPFVHAYYQSMWIAKIVTDLNYKSDGKETVWSSKYLPPKKEMVKWMKKNKQFSGKRSQHLLPHAFNYHQYICKQIGETYPPYKKKSTNPQSQQRLSV